MKKAKLVAALLFLCLLAVWITRRTPSHEPAKPPESATSSTTKTPSLARQEKSQAAEATAAAPVTAPAIAAVPANTTKSTKRIARSQARYDWKRITAFNDWVKEFTTATPEQRELMKEQGLILARARRNEFKNLIVADPERALEQSVKPLVRQQLPAEILAELEKPVSARGDFNVYMGRPAPGTEVDGRDLTLRYFETTKGESYIAHVFGEAETVMTRKNIAARGVAVDRELAVAPSAVRQLGTGEKVPAGTTVQESCPVSGLTTVLESGFEEPIKEDTTAIEFEGKIIVLCNGSHVRVLEDEHRLTSNISASGGPGGAHPIKDNFPGTASEAIGVFKALYIRAVYPDRLQVPNTEASAMEDMKNFERFYLESSYGRLSVTPAFTPVVVLPHTREWYEAKDDEVDGLGLVHSHSRSEARRLGFDSGEFNVTIVRINGGPRLSGISWGGGDSVWVSWDGMDVINHECGHSIGRPHANFWNTGGQSAIGIGANQEYGNSFDVMGGGGGFTAHYNTISKRSLGWLPAQNTHNPTVSGVYRIFAYDQPALEEGKRYGIRVPKDRTRGYNLEYHNNYGIEHTSRVELRNSALVIWSGFGGAGHLIDTTPGTPGGKDDSGIEVGRTFSDAAAGVHFTVVNRNNNTSPESLDVAVNYGNPTTNVAPTLALTATTTNVAINGSITFTANATDANGDTLAYHWDFGDGLPSTNLAVFTRTFTAARQHNVLCTVTDMKGGTTRRHLVVVIGNPTRGTVYGRVTNGGVGVQDVLVGTSSRYTYTDADGYYALADLTVGSQTITPLLYGNTFTPASSVIAVVAGANTLNFAANPLAQVSIVGTADARENGTNGAFTITRTGSTAAALDVRVMSAGGTAARTTDYNFLPNYVDDGNYRTFTIPVGQAELVVAVTSINDAAAEGPETITLQLAEGTNYIGTTLGAAGIILHDDDTTLPQVSITAEDTEASEVPGNVTAFTVSRTGSTAGNLNVALQYGGTATRGSDYPNLPSSVTIPDGQSSITLIVTPVNDSAVEGSENVTVTIPSGAAYVLDTAATSVDLLILDDDIPLVTVTAIKPNASETNREPGVFLVSRTGPTTAPLKVYYGLGGTAQHGTDYVGLPAEITIPAGAASAPVFITPYDDNFGEGVETVDIQLTVFNGAYLVTTPSAASINITDNNDAPHVSVISMSSTTSEPADGGTLRFRLEGSRPGPTTVRYTLSGTAIPGVDYSTNNLQGTIILGSPVNGSSQTDVTVSILNDAIKEDVESIVLTLQPDPAYIFFNDDVATILLRDDDQPIVSITPWNTAPAEGAANAAAFYIGRTGPTFAGLTTGDLTVNYAITGTAANGVDYALLSGTVIIPNGSNSVDIPITSIEDGLFEGTETITLTLLPSPDYGIGESSATLYLADNESYTLSVGFLTQASTTSEVLDATNGEYRLLPVILSALNTNVVTVEYIMGADTTAWGDGIDWDLVDAANGNAPIKKGTLTFPIGVTNQFIKIRIYPDALIEGTEMAAIELRNPTGCRLSTSRNPHDLTILDNTNNYAAPRVMFITGTSSVEEDDDSAPLLMVGLDRPAFTTVTVNYAVTGGTATAGSDFTLPGGTLTFLAGEVSKSIPLAVINDTTVESSETVIVSLSAPSGAALGPIAAHTVTLLDNDTGTPEVTVAATDATSTENGDTGAFTVTRTSGGAANALTVDYVVSGTATAGSDYTTLPGSVTIPAGQASAPVIVSTLNDGSLEPIETVTLKIIPAAGYAFGANITATVNIVDDETQALPPVAQNQDIFVPRNQPSGITLTAIDPSGDPLTYSVITPPAHGSLTGTPPNLTFTPTLNYTGPDSFTFRATDGVTTSGVATVSLTIYNSTLVASNSVWRYNDLGIDQGTGWVTNGFNDSSWSNGAARLGFGDPRTTTVRGQPVITYYFRQKFTLPAGLTVTSLVARAQRDDGIVVHLNGSEAYRELMPAGAIGYSTRPTTSVGGADETAWFTTNLNPALLVAGTNIIAAEVHQIDGSSSDMGFALELTGTGVPTPAATPTVTIAATDASATEPGDAASFTVTRLGTNHTAAVDIFYGLSGTATPGFDYAPLSGVVTIPAGQSNAVITLNPLDDFDLELVETAVLTLAPGVGYVIDSSISAMATINDDDASHVPPTALAQSVLVIKNQSGEIVLTGSDLENDPLTFQIVSQPANGSLSGTAPYITYTPDTNFTGADSFTFRVTDGGAWSSPATVSLTVYDPALLVTSNSVWRYHDKGVDLGASWRSNTFNDSTWSNGLARLGFGGDGEVTTLSGQPVITYYFRKAFVLPANYTVTNLVVSIARDDGAVVYLNGVEVARDNIAAGTVLYSTRATNAANEQIFYPFTANVALLQPGTNIIAAEVHQVDGSSSDIGFNLQLRGDGYFSAAPPPPLLAYTLSSSNTVHLWFPSQNGLRYAIEGSTDLVTWQSLTTNTATGGLLQYSQSATNPPVRFFRARLVP
jgi:hypothetical protein